MPQTYSTTQNHETSSLASQKQYEEGTSTGLSMREVTLIAV